MRIETLAVHAGNEVDAATGAVTPPIHLSTTFERDADGSYSRGHVYSRTSNPNREALERTLGALEGGAEAAAFASGSAAAMSVLQALRPGDHVLAPSDVYHGTAKLLREVMAPWGLEISFADLTDGEAAQAALRPNTRLVWVETPSNPLLKITDVARVTELAHAVGAVVACDNTWATPVSQRPFELGADLIVHATTKYLGGHSDVLGGAVVSRERGGVFERVRLIQTTGGAVPSPFECWLVLRGIRTLPYRMRAHSENALAVAARVRVFTRATSLGGPESLIEHRASIEGPQTRTPENLLRLSIGLEHPDDLTEDLAQALEDLTPYPLP